MVDLNKTMQTIPGRVRKEDPDVNQHHTKKRIGGVPEEALLSHSSRNSLYVEGLKVKS